MTLIKSISGIRGTIGGRVNDGLTPIDAVKFAAAYGTWLINRAADQKIKVVIGRDARISGPMISDLVVAEFSQGAVIHYTIGKKKKQLLIESFEQLETINAP